jgi:hypothetical protein
MERRIGRSLVLMTLFWASPILASGRIEMAVGPRRPEPGQMVTIRIEADVDAGEVHALLLRPTAGTEPLVLRAGPATAAGSRTYEASLTLEPDAPQGLYAVHAWTGDGRAPGAIGKGWFLRGRILLDYPIMSLVDAARPAEDIRAYLEDFRGLGGNILVLHVLMDAQQAYYPSRIARTGVRPGTPGDYVETFLGGADHLGFPCLLSVSWDMTHETDYAKAPAEIAAITDELWSLYGHHPSLAGFYSYQEGSGTYFVPYLRAFCGHVKALHPNLLAACAPYVDDPLLAGYMAVLEPLDLIVYQGQTMASFRPDNVKHFPLRRVRDLCGVGVGAKWLQDKIAITHTELFGYLENRISKDHNTTTYENIFGQILSAATAAGSDGISFFTYHANVHAAGRVPSKAKDIARARQAVVDGLKVYDLIWEKVARKPNAVAFYYPYEDWAVERFANSYVPAFDAFRRLGVAADFVPFSPAPKESFYPFYPYRPNEGALGRFLKERIALVLPDVSGFHTTDSEFLKAFLERGGAALAFGPHLPMGNTYDRDTLLGAVESARVTRREILVGRAKGSRAKKGARFGLEGDQAWTGWRPNGAEVVASFEDGSAAVFMNRVGRGVIAGFAMDAAAAARDIPDVVRDVLDAAMAVTGARGALDVLGANENVDLASCAIEGGARAAVVNHGTEPLDIVLRPLAGSQAPGTWTDLVTGLRKPECRADGALSVTVPARGCVCLEFRK